MKKGPEETHYQILGIPVGASPSEINRAYRRSVEPYQDDSMAACSFFPDAERKAILARLERAFLALMNQESRSAYDQSLLAAGTIKEEERYRDCSKKVIPIYDARYKKTLYPWLSRVPVEDNACVSEDPVIQDILKKESLNGQDLKKIRTQQGVTLVQIFQQTRVRVGVLEAIEEGRLDQLPPGLYLKNFLRLYARSLRIDDEKVVSAYMKHVNGGS